MVVAVRLVEVLTLITALGILTAGTVFIVAADRILFITLGLLKPVSILFQVMTTRIESSLLWILDRLLSLADGVGANLAFTTLPKCTL